ncbi:MAG: TonB-dependent receptor [Sphingobacteriales bacterium]|nr:TonB-dependent receptor [Sphingobacteriales bacterium]
MKYIFSLRLLLAVLGYLLWIQESQAQIILQGSVKEIDEQQQESSVIGAFLYWQGTAKGAVSDENGNFEIERVPHRDSLIVSFIGYQSDTLYIPPQHSERIDILLAEANSSLDEVQIRARRGSTFISTLKSIKAEEITTDELAKAACCNLSESFETNASVDVNYTDAITGAKEIRMLGLDGSYVQMLSENMPSLRGLASTYGLEYVPGPWMESIQISKGVGSVVNGYESITGQINVEYKKPHEAEKLLVNVYAGDAGRYEASLNFRHKLPLKGFESLWLLHGNILNAHHDRNGDTFLDMPLRQQAQIYHRTHFRFKKQEGQFGIKYLQETRKGGQVAFHEHDSHLGGENPYYGFQNQVERGEIYLKTGRIFEKPATSLGLQLQGIYHDQNAFFGKTDYDAVQKSFYGNLIYQTILGTSDHVFKTGASFINDHYQEQVADSLFSRREQVPGVFAEYNYIREHKFSFLAGLRLDHHNLYGFFVTPRLHAKYNFSELSSLRASVGRGFRRANLFAENSFLFLSSRPFALRNGEALKPEIAWNYGINFTQVFRFAEREGTFTADAYHTNFLQQSIVDAFSDPNRILIYNLEGKSYSNYLQAQIDAELLRRLDVRLAGKMEEVRITYGTLSDIQLPLVPRFSALLNISYKMPLRNWHFNATAQYTGKQNLAVAAADGKVPQSKDFVTFNAQINYHIKSWEIYVGGENLGDFHQANPIRGYEQPFEAGFDASNVWGPIYGRMLYVGMRWGIGIKPDEH